jgi:hypothetical protein
MASGQSLLEDPLGRPLGRNTIPTITTSQELVGDKYTLGVDVGQQGGDATTVCTVRGNHTTWEHLSLPLPMWHRHEQQFLQDPPETECTAPVEDHAFRWGLFNTSYMSSVPVRISLGRETVLPKTLWEHLLENCNEDD